MTQIDTDIEIFSFPKPNNNESHINCCKSKDISLCGKDISDYTSGELDSVDCSECNLLELSSHCPLGLICPFLDDSSQ